MPLEIIIPGKYTPGQVKRAEAKRLEFRRNRYTSGCAHLDDLIALGKAVMLCDDHTRKFNVKAARYRLHPAKNMKRVRSKCDVCKQFGFANLFLNEKDAHEEAKKAAQYERAVEYGKHVAA